MTTSEMTTRNDLAWLANCYVADELSTDEAAAFEARLANDEAACDAVARAMELNLAIAAAFDSQPATLVPQHSAFSIQPSAPSRRTASTITALAATAVAAAVVALMVGRSPTANGVARKDGADRLVAAWASGEAARNNAADDDTLELADDADLDPPDWMLAALTAADVNEKLPGNDEVREN
jgi:ferric-dicitrate binding protein FerR (iron transport regulator)